MFVYTCSSNSLEIVSSFSFFRQFFLIYPIYPSSVRTFFQSPSFSITVTLSFLDTSVRYGLFTPPLYLTCVSFLTVAVLIFPQSLIIMTLCGSSYVLNSIFVYFCTKSSAIYAVLPSVFIIV